VCGRVLLLEPMLVVLGHSWGLCWQSWAALGASVGSLGPKDEKNVAILKSFLFLERERDLWPRGRFWVALGADVGDLGPLLELMLAALSRSWGLRLRS
jgi:hypothetical protein